MTSVTATADPNGQFLDCRNKSTNALPIKKYLAAAEKGRDQEFSHQQDEHQHAPCRDSRHGKRQSHLQEGAERRAAQIARCFENCLSSFVQRNENWKNHERQVTVNNTHHHGAKGVLIRRTPSTSDEFQQCRNSAPTQNKDPRIGSDQQAGPERHNDQNQQVEASSADPP